MNRTREIAELIELIERLDLQASEIQQEREDATERLRTVREEEERARAAQARAERHANRGIPRAIVIPDIQAGDRVIILSRVVLPVGIAGTRPVNEDDRRGVVTSVSQTGTKFYILTNSGNTTWRLRRHIARE